MFFLHLPHPEENREQMTATQNLTHSYHIMLSARRIENQEKKTVTKKQSTIISYKEYQQDG